jgi:hypothetical protein
MRRRSRQPAFLLMKGFYFLADTRKLGGSQGLFRSISNAILFYFILE